MRSIPSPCLALALLAPILLAAPSVRAQSIAAGDDRHDEEEVDDNPFHASRGALGFGALIGSMPVGPVRGPGAGLQIEAGWHRGRFTLYGEYDFLRIGQDTVMDKDGIRGTDHRIGGMARYSVGEFGGGETIPLQGNVWLEGGLGRQFIQWDEGGRLARNDVAGGIGAELDVMTHRSSKRPNVFSIFYAFRVIAAHGPRRSETATCSGPCDEATRPPPWDIGMFFNMGLTWGR